MSDKWEVLNGSNYELDAYITFFNKKEEIDYRCINKNGSRIGAKPPSPGGKTGLVINNFKAGDEKKKYAMLKLEFEKIPVHENIQGLKIVPGQRIVEMNGLARTFTPHHIEAKSKSTEVKKYIVIIHYMYVNRPPDPELPVHLDKDPTVIHPPDY